MENSIYYLLVCFGTSLFCIGLVFFLRMPFFILSTIAVKQLDIILNTTLGEKEKDKRILNNLVQLLYHLFKTIILLVFNIIAGIIPSLIYIQFTSRDHLDVSSIYFYLSMIIGSCVLLLFKGGKSDYSYWSKLLHTIILDNYNIGKFLFKRELKKASKTETQTNHNFVIITGLARAGTTALTNLLYDPKSFHSISYANMPFLMTPNLWKKLYNPKSGKMKERAHGDKVLFSENSIEALEEYFFKAHLNDEFICESTLELHSVNDVDYLSYLSYQQLFKKQKRDTVYLSKNNNFMLRYVSMRQHNKHFKLVLIFRNPISHAHSLKKQNKNFISQQSEDSFILNYMNWLGHYEFGLNQKVFDFGYERIWLKYNKDSLNYWLALWVNYHEYVLQFSKDENLFLVDYEDLLNSPEELKAKLAICTNVDLLILSQEKFVNNKKLNDNTEEVNEDLLTKANTIYQELLGYKIDLTIKQNSSNKT